jgi:hypothetical protein
MSLCFGGIVPTVLKDREFVFDGLTLRMKAPQSVKITKTASPVTQHCIPEDFESPA